MAFSKLNLEVKRITELTRFLKDEKLRLSVTQTGARSNSKIPMIESKPVEMVAPQDINTDPEGQTLEKGELTASKKKAVKASVALTRPERKTRRRPTEKYSIDVVIQVDEDKRRQTEVKTSNKNG